MRILAEVDVPIGALCKDDDGECRYVNDHTQRCRVFGVELVRDGSRDDVNDYAFEDIYFKCPACLEACRMADQKIREKH